MSQQTPAETSLVDQPRSTQASGQDSDRAIDRAVDLAIEQAGPINNSDIVDRQMLAPFVASGFLAELTEELQAAKVTPDSSRFDMVRSPHATLESSARVTAWPAKVDLLGVEISLTDYDSLARLIVAAGQRNEPALATFLPVHGVVTAATDAGYKYRINSFDVVAPDGQPVRWALNWIHKAGLVDRVSGPEMMLRLCQRAANEGVSIYLYGSSQDTLDRLKANLKQRFPALEIAGMEAPPFRALTAEENDAAVERINASGAGLVFLGLGLPRQDYFAHHNRHGIKAVQLCVGAAFDFHAGKKKLAPAWMQKSGLEWTYRLIQEPRRLWKRYLVTNTVFVYLMTRRLLRGK
jgi:exopolysaccharide biosynthesis WecB/TagA/CpsF family protein